MIQYLQLSSISVRIWEKPGYVVPSLANRVVRRNFMIAKKLENLGNAAGWVVFIFGFVPMFHAIYAPGQDGTGPILISVFIMMAGLWMIDAARFRVAIRPIARKALIRGLDGQDWQFNVLMSQGRILAPEKQEDRILDIAPIRITRPDDMPQLYYHPVRVGGRTDGQIIGAKILGVVYYLPH